MQDSLKQSIRFSQRKNAEEAIIEIIKYLNENLDKGKKCAAVFLNLTKVFHMAYHGILLKKFEAIGIKGVTREWFKRLCQMERKK